MGSFRFIGCLLLVALFAVACQTPGNVKPEASATLKEEFVSAEPQENLEEPEPAKAPVVQSDFGRHLTLQGLITNAFETQYFSWESLLEAPPDQFAENMLVQLKKQEAKPFLAKGVEAYAGDNQGLAVAYENGHISVFSDWPCPSVASPVPAGMIAWSPSSRYLTSLDQNRLELKVYDLELCGEVIKQTMPSVVKRLVQSRTGKYIACIDEVHRLYLASPPNPLKDLVALRYDTLALAFTPQEEVLLIVDEGGWITLLDSSTGKELNKFFIPGGPYAEAALNGRSLQLTDKQGVTKALDIVTKEPVAFKSAREYYALENGVLYYLSRQERYLRQMRLSRPSLEVWYSASAAAFKVRDMDSKVRYYSAESGEQLNEVDSDDWMETLLSEDMSFSLAGHEYRLAEVIRQENGLSLLCRAISESGFYLWWKPGIVSMDVDIVPGALPIRQGILADSDISWVMLNQPK